MSKHQPSRILMMRITFGIVLFGVLVLAGCGSQESGEPKPLKLAYVMAPGGPAHDAAEILARLIKEKTAGQLTIKLFPSAQLGNDRELAEAVMIGSIDMVVSGTAPIGWYLPEYGAIEAPFAFRDYGHLDAVLDGPIGQEITKAFLNERQTRIIDWWHRGPRYLTTTDRKITKPADLEGLKLRVPELPTYIQAWRLLGTNPTPITYSEIFMALKQGIVEGQENPLEVIYTSSFAEVQKYVMKTEHLLGAYMVMMNEAKFERLSPEHQKALVEAVEEAGRREHELMVQYDDEFTKKLHAAGVEFVDVDREAFRTTVVTALAERFQDQWTPGLFRRMIETK
ncbi:MAG: TRAP transporter substrate-binding protein [Pirellulales bacterium]|nr:TRAP transporter substrate-binding protein [Pirellulales bacterium]